MDRFLAELTASDAVAYAAGDLTTYRVTPFDTTCVQGAFRYPARAFAQRGEKMFFIAYETQQYGVGRWDGSGEGRIVDADQYLTPDAALKRFLAEETSA